MTKQYETTFIINAHLQGEHVDATIDKILKSIEDGGGELLSVDRWGKRRLAYEIAKKQYGYYVYARYEADGLFVKNFERGLQLDDSILRYLTIIVPKAMLQQLENPEKTETVKKDAVKEESKKELADVGEKTDQGEQAVSEVKAESETKSEVIAETEKSADADTGKSENQDKAEETPDPKDMPDQTS